MKPNKTDHEEPTVTMLWINVLLAIPFIALWAGIPLWLVLKRPDAKPPLAAAPAVRTLPAVPSVQTLPAVRREDAGGRRVA